MQEKKKMSDCKVELAEVFKEYEDKRIELEGLNKAMLDLSENKIGASYLVYFAQNAAKELAYLEISCLCIFGMSKPEFEKALNDYRIARNKDV